MEASHTRMTPARHVDAIARHMQDGDRMAAEDEYDRMLADSPALQDFAAAAGLGHAEWLAELDRRHLWSDDCTLGDRIWLMGPSLTLRRVELGYVDITPDMTMADAERAMREHMAHAPVSVLVNEGGPLVKSVMELIGCYTMTRGEVDAGDGGSLGPWLPGSDEAGPYDRDLCPRMRAGIRMVGEIVRIGMADGTLTDAMQDVTGSIDAAPIVGHRMGATTLEAFESLGDSVLRVAWSHDGGIVRDACMSPWIAATCVLAGAWPLLDWVYAESAGAHDADCLLAGYMECISDWLDEQRPCEPLWKDDDHDIVVSAHDEGVKALEAMMEAD